jgi:hypothetical protein
VTASEKLSTILSFTPYSYNFTHIRIEASVHFIDSWEGQSAYLKLPRDDTYLWIDSYNSNKHTQLEDDLCGSPEFGEGRFATEIDVVISKQHLD